ncbi:hypothetical protein ACUXNS_000507 [Brevibacterium pityocampae]
MPSSPTSPEFIEHAGASLVTLNAYEERGPIRWAHRTTSKDPVDNGWRILSGIDESDYLSDPANWRIADFNELCSIEPALIVIWDLPVGTELRLDVSAAGRRVWIDETTGRPLTDSNGSPGQG